MKKILCLILGLVMSAGIFVTVSAQEEIKIFLNGKEIVTDVPPQLINDRTMVPVRFIFEALGASVTWDEATSTAKGYRMGIEISMTIDENVFYRNGKALALDSPAVVVNDRTLVPVRAIAESFNCKVAWEEDTNSVIITTDEITFGICPDLPPFSYAKDGRIIGADIEIAVELADRMGLSPIFKVYKYEQLEEAVINEEVDFVISGISKTQEWLNSLNVTDSYYTSKLIIVTNINSSVDPTNLKGRKIGVLKDSVAETYVNFDMDGFRVYSYGTVDELFDALKKVDIACVVGDENALAGMAEEFLVHDTTYAQEEFVICFKKGNSELTDKINAYLSEMKNDSTLDKILDAHIKR